MPLYLDREHHLDPFLVGLVVGSGPLASTVGGFIAGTLSDFFGRRLVMLGSLYLSSLAFVGFAFTHQAALLLLLIIVKGF
ncbi:MFS transporter, partial [Microbacteriaceae bacterium K1510]|nr:MFS transporter [Microbacteriaceae bacterium K1510]